MALLAIYYSCDLFYSVGTCIAVHLPSLTQYRFQKGRWEISCRLFFYCAFGAFCISGVVAVASRLKRLMIWLLDCITYHLHRTTDIVCRFRFIIVTRYVQILFHYNSIKYA